MEKRWFALAISAYTSKVIDFSTTTRNNPKSIFIENLVFNELERERRIHFKTAKCWYSIVNLLDTSETVFGGWSEGEKEGMFELLFPWKKDKRSIREANPELAAILQGFKRQ